MDPRPTDDSEVNKLEWVFEVVVQTDTHDHAEQVMVERVDFSEDYGFDYRIWLKNPEGKPSHSESAKGIARMYSAAHTVEAIVGLLESGAAKIHSVDEGNGYMDVSLTVRVMGPDDRIKPTTYTEDTDDDGRFLMPDSQLALEERGYGGDEPDTQAMADADDAVQLTDETTTES